MVHQLRVALIVLFLGFSGMIGFHLIAQQDRIYQSNVPGIDPENPLAQYGIESDEHKAYVAAKIRNVRFGAAEMEIGLITAALALWIVLPVFSRDWQKDNAGKT